MQATEKRRALILFAHGARDPRWAVPFQRLQQQIQTQLQTQQPDVLVSLAFLELMAPQLPELVPQLMQAGCNDVTIVPVFLGQGGHVLRDLPLVMAQLQTDYPTVQFKVAQAVGEDPQVLNAIAGYCTDALATTANQ